MATHLLVSNATAQSGKNEERIAVAQEYFRARGVSVDVLATLPEGRTIGAVTEEITRGRYKVVVAMGGDGTFREVAAGICDSARRQDVALGMLPTGTANDQGKSFGLEALPESLERNVEIICEGHETRLDAGLLEQGPAPDDLPHRARFFDSAGFGFSARVLAQRNEDRKVVETLGPVKEIYQCVHPAWSCRSHLPKGASRLRPRSTAKSGRFFRARGSRSRSRRSASSFPARPSNRTQCGVSFRES